jgi:hypothetical protein
MPEKDARAPECFVIGPIGDPGTETNTRANQFFRYLVAPVAEEFGYKAVRGDQLSRPGIISTQLIQHVADADLVVADLTDHNPNVFYELAVRHAMQRPLVQFIDRAQRLPFDIAGMRTIFFDIHDLDSVEDARSQFRGYLEAKDDQPIDTPISVARDMKRLWESDDPTAMALADVLAEVSALRGEVRSERPATTGVFTTPVTYAPGTISGRAISAGTLVPSPGYLSSGLYEPAVTSFRADPSQVIFPAAGPPEGGVPEGTPPAEPAKQPPPKAPKRRRQVKKKDPGQ